MTLSIQPIVIDNLEGFMDETIRYKKKGAGFSGSLFVWERKSGDALLFSLNRFS